MSSIQNYTIEQAAKILGCAPRYLKDNLARLPHQKIGIAAVFDDDELLEIKAMHRVRPQAAASGAPAVQALAHIRPRRAARTG
ncbi:hypothetical protein OG264_15920 [Streptomyces xanthophaeus]|uniref:hypothetical protein n=1 Tax=Streptomyces xanthophaeus TaxID=67385 RepID=UPI00386BC2CB|nr:hypothetical protein OG264_15920 [Streptomyces xanthophaeus]WST62179.1 hypothetical protein OG605_22515 [Streptomyces xanthophaeus]